MKKILFLPALFFLQTHLFAQKAKADSLENLLVKERTDTGKVKLMWQIAGMLDIYDPERALVLSQQALALATKIKYLDGQSKALGALALAFTKLGNFPRALEYNFKKLQIDEKRNSPPSLASVLINIGIVYNQQEEYQDALLYYYRSDSVINLYNIESLRYFSMMNLGDVYFKLNNNDSAFSYFNKALIVSNNEKNEDYIGNAMTGLGHTYFKQGSYPFALLNYRTAITHLTAANDDDVLCEASLGLAKLYLQINNNDSAAWYSFLSLSIAKRDGFMSKELEATQFLANYYKKVKDIDSAFVYLTKVQQLNDSINSKGRIREMQLISSDEKLRQLEVEENKRVAKKERKQQLQYLFIGMFIPGFFLFTLLLSRIRIHIRVIKVLGILSLLILFEYLLLLLHPTVAAFTNHTPVYEMFIFVSIAAILIPAHHRFEHWLIEKLIHRDGSIRLKKIKLKVKGPAT